MVDEPQDGERTLGQPAGETAQRSAQQTDLSLLIESPEFNRMVERFQSSTGLRLQVFGLDSRPLTEVGAYPRYCRLLQEGKSCPLYFDLAYLRREREGIGVCCAGVGHFLAPVRNERQEQIGVVVSPPVKFSTNAVEPLAELAFRLRVFPDDLIQAAEAIPEQAQEKLLGSGETVAVGLNLLAEMQARQRVTQTLRRLQLQIAESNAETLSQHLVEAVLYLARADFGLVVLAGDQGDDLARGFDHPGTTTEVEAKRKLLEGVAEWVRHAGRGVSVPDLAQSAWSRFLTQDAVSTGSLLGVSIPTSDGRSFGAMVVGFDAVRDDLEELMSSLNEFVADGLYAILMGRKLVEAEQLSLRDQQSGAYTRRYLEDLLEREISRASRYRHELALVMLEINGFDVLAQSCDEQGLGRLLRELVAVISARTRKMNTLARFDDARFVLVIPEAGREVAVRLGETLRSTIEEHPFSLKPSGEIVRIGINAGFAASPEGGIALPALMAQAEASLELARLERRKQSFRP